MTETAQWQKTCPVCGDDNTCAVAAGKDPQSCWCWQTQISAPALDAIPAEAKGRVCLCPACAQQQGESSER